MRFISVISIHCTRKDFYNVKLEQEDNIEKSILAGEIRTIKKFRKERKPKFQVLKISIRLYSCYSTAVIVYL